MSTKDKGKAPSPNEAPKGEVIKQAVKRGVKQYIKTFKMLAQPLAPDKEWAIKLNAWAYKELEPYFQGEFGTMDTMLELFIDQLASKVRQLLKAKDQEADRRVAEAIREISDIITPEGFEKPDLCYDQLALIEMKCIDLIKKLSLKGE